MTDRSKLEEQVDTQAEQIDELQRKLRAYEEKFEELKEPPLISAYVLRLQGKDLDESEVTVYTGSQILKVTTGEVAKDDLRQGQYVWLHPKTYAVMMATHEFENGIVGKVSDLWEGKVIVSLGEGAEKRVVEADMEALGEEVKPGYEVALLPPSMEIMSISEAVEVKEIFLGEVPNVRYADIGGLEDQMERIRDVIELPYMEPEMFEKVQLKPPKGVLLYGPPGCGKTLLAKAVATENDMTFFNVQISDILSKWVGESENMIKHVFQKARERSPSIIFFDEFDALATTRGTQDTAGVHKNLIAQILSEMDGIESLHDVYILGATNRPDMVDPALLRPGRFDEVIEIDRPGRKAGRKILEIYLSDGLPIDPTLVEEHGSKAKAVEALREMVVDELYGDDKWIEFKLDDEAKESVKTIKRKDAVSGALIESIVTTAKKNYVKRAMKHPKGSAERDEEGIGRDDLKRAVDEESKEHALVELRVYRKRQREMARVGGQEGVEVM